MQNRRRSRSNRMAGRQSPDEEQKQEEEALLRTPPKRVRLNVSQGEEAEVQDSEVAAVNAVNSGNVITPGATSTSRRNEDESISAQDTASFSRNARRALFTPSAKVSQAAPVTPSRDLTAPAAKRRLMFGRMVSEIHVQENVRKVYKIVRRLTGSLGGNASSGPIYGELTMGSMQKMVNLMKEYTDFNAQSRFIDVGSGIGKPSLHVAQDPGVCFSYGIEVEESRWLLGMTCLRGMLEEAARESREQEFGPDEQIQHRCVFEKGDIREARLFDPFSHVYMFSIGFPPRLWIDLAAIWNRSSSPYMICYHGPRDIIETYEFDVELIAQIQTSMHGSREGHMGYIYKRKSERHFDERACDPRFVSAFDRARKQLPELKADIDEEVGRATGTRASRRRM